ncbi:MAG: hypothetical protein ACYCSF_07670 [Acidimicrobiales bacterium]
MRRRPRQQLPEPRAQRSFTDPESQMMKTNDGFQYALNAQAVVDECAQVMVFAACSSHFTGTAATGRNGTSATTPARRGSARAIIPPRHLVCRPPASTRQLLQP